MASYKLSNDDIDDSIFTEMKKSITKALPNCLTIGDKVWEISKNKNESFKSGRKAIKENNSQYLCVWDKDGYSGETYAIVDYDFFSDEKGYQSTDRIKIAELQDGEIYRPADIDDFHLVVKLKD